MWMGVKNVVNLECFQTLVTTSLNQWLYIEVNIYEPYGNHKPKTYKGYTENKEKGIDEQKWCVREKPIVFSYYLSHSLKEYRIHF